MKYIKTYELFYYDGGPYYPSAKDPSKPKLKDLSNDHPIWSELNQRYYNEEDLNQIIQDYYKSNLRKIRINNTKELDYYLANYPK